MSQNISKLFPYKFKLKITILQSAKNFDCMRKTLRDNLTWENNERAHINISAKPYAIFFAKIFDILCHRHLLALWCCIFRPAFGCCKLQTLVEIVIFSIFHGKKTTLWFIELKFRSHFMDAWALESLSGGIYLLLNLV